MATTIGQGGDRRRQTRSVATRRRILDAAVKLFAVQGYCYTGTIEIVAESGMTGGAFYHHFDGKESVAEAILVETDARVHEAFVAAGVGLTALRALVAGTIAVARLHVDDAAARVSSQLMHTVGRATGQASQHFDSWSDVIASQLRLAQNQGEVRADVDPVGVGRSIACATYGAWAVASFGSEPSTIVDRLVGVWNTIVDGIVVPGLIAGLREDLAIGSCQPGHTRLAAPTG